MARLRFARGGLLAEVVASLALVMLAATLVIAALLFAQSESRLRDLLGRALRAEALALPMIDRPLVPGTTWWRLAPGGGVQELGSSALPIDPRTRALALSAREQAAPLVQPGSPWEPIRFAVPGPGGEVRVARLPVEASVRLRAAPLALVAGLLVVDVVVFTAFGASLLRRRVVDPLQRLAAATREVAAGGFEARLPVEGPREAALVAASFNTMSEALARRTAALEKAVRELRDANAALRVARSGLDRSQRLAAVGRLAAGVAHEVGNPMGALLAFLSLVERDAALSGESRAHLARAAEQGERVRRILRNLLAFSRPPRMELAPVALDAIAEEAASLVRAQRRYAGVQLEVEAEGGPPLALADAGAVGQILLNLVLNAADAVLACEPGAGVVRLHVRGACLAVRAQASAEEAAARRQPDAVECRVEDQGAGIDDADRERLFDPFFTTKPPGEGTGLGLANSLRLAEELGGTLELGVPQVGFRTAFVLRLPAVRGSASDCAVRTDLRGQASGKKAEGNETVEQ